MSTATFQYGSASGNAWTGANFHDDPKPLNPKTVQPYNPTTVPELSHLSVWQREWECYLPLRKYARLYHPRAEQHGKLNERHGSERLMKCPCA